MEAQIKIDLSFTKDDRTWWLWKLLLTIITLFTYAVAYYFLDHYWSSIIASAFFGATAGYIICYYKWHNMAGMVILLGLLFGIVIAQTFSDIITFNIITLTIFSYISLILASSGLNRKITTLTNIISGLLQFGILLLGFYLIYHLRLQLI